MLNNPGVTFLSRCQFGRLRELTSMPTSIIIRSMGMIRVGMLRILLLQVEEHS
jgi:hypothetical protein